MPRKTSVRGQRAEVRKKPFNTKGKFGNKCILSHYVSVQTIVSPYDADCVTPLIYPTTDLDFLFWIIVSFDLSFFVTFTQPFCKRHYPTTAITKTRQDWTQLQYTFVYFTFIHWDHKSVTIVWFMNTWFLKNAKKCNMAHFCTTKSLKWGHLFLVKDDFCEDLYFV